MSKTHRRRANLCLNGPVQGAAKDATKYVEDRRNRSVFNRPALHYGSDQGKQTLAQTRTRTLTLTRTQTRTQTHSKSNLHTPNTPLTLTLTLTLTPGSRTRAEKQEKEKIIVIDPWRGAKAGGIAL
jgi:hypothetical protein